MPAKKKPTSRSGRVPKRVEAVFARACLWDVQLQALDTIRHAVRATARGLLAPETEAAWATVRQSVLNARAYAWQDVGLTAFAPDEIRPGGESYRARYAGLIAQVAGSRLGAIEATVDPSEVIADAVAELRDRADRDGEDTDG